MRTPGHSLYLLITAAVAVVAVMALPPIAQDPAYHVFADRRGWLGIPNFLNVISNLAFLAVGGAGIWLCLMRPPASCARRAWLVCFIGVALVALGSSYYHLAPGNSTLVWDRLPMSIALMALWVALLAERVDPKLENLLLIPAVLVGMASVVYWSFTDDLRPYVLVQFLPLLMIPVILWRYPAPGRDRDYLLTALLLYVLAKLAEHLDRWLFELSSYSFSGHSLKHLLAALAMLGVYRMLGHRALMK